MIKLPYEVEKKSITPVKNSQNSESESKGGLHIDITTHSFLGISLKGKACILNSVRKVDMMVFLLYLTLKNHRLCERYQVCKDYDVSQEKFGLIEKK